MYLLLQPQVQTYGLLIRKGICLTQAISQDEASDPYADGLEELASASCVESPGDASSSEVSSVTAGRLERLIGQLKSMGLGEGGCMGSCEVTPKPDGKPVGPKSDNPEPVDKSWVSSECKVVDLTGSDGGEAKTPTLTGSPSQRLAQFFKNKKKQDEQNAKGKTTGVPPSSISSASASKSREMPKNEYVLPDFVP